MASCLWRLRIEWVYSAGPQVMETGSLISRKKDFIPKLTAHIKTMGDSDL